MTCGPRAPRRLRPRPRLGAPTPPSYSRARARSPASRWSASVRAGCTARRRRRVATKLEQTTRRGADRAPELGILEHRSVPSTREDFAPRVVPFAAIVKEHVGAPVVHLTPATARAACLVGGISFVCVIVPVFRAAGALRVPSAVESRAVGIVPPQRAVSAGGTHAWQLLGHSGSCWGARRISRRIRVVNSCWGILQRLRRRNRRDFTPGQCGHCICYFLIDV